MNAFDASIRVFRAFLVVTGLVLLFLVDWKVPVGLLMYTWGREIYTKYFELADGEFDIGEEE